MKKKQISTLPAPPDVIEFTVDDIHIQAGQRWNVITNPLTKALNDHLRDQGIPARDVQVGYLLAYVNGEEYTLDGDTKVWMNAFLHKESVQPFKARLKKGADAASVFNSGAKAAYTHL
jgi:hypothetical protein